MNKGTAKTISFILNMACLLIAQGIFSKSFSLFPHGVTLPYFSKISFVEYIRDASREFNVKPEIVAAVIHAESNFNPRARSSFGAMGLMQITHMTAHYLGLRDTYNPRDNIFAGTKYLKELIGTFGNNLHLAIAAYNAGPGAVKKFGGVPPYKETRAYVTKVMKLIKEYKSHPDIYI